MADDGKAKIVLSAADQTKAAFDSVKRSLTQAGELANTANASFARLGAILGSAFAVGTFTEFFKGTAEGLAKLEDLRVTVGSTANGVSALEDIGKRTGNTFETVADTLVRFNKSLIEAKAGTEAAEVFKALGLSVAELKAVDPAEALRQTAVALGGFASTGDKARAIQILFTKSVQEVAPFLKDLADKTTLVGTATQDHLDAAKKFNDELSKMHKNSEDLARSLVGDLLPAINRFLEKKNSQGLLAALGFDDEFSEKRKLAALAEGVNTLAARVKLLQNAMAIGFYGKEHQKELDDTIAKLEVAKQKFRDATKVFTPDPSAAGGRGFVNPPNVKPELVVPDVEAQKALDDLLKKIRERGDAERQQIKLGRDLTDAEKYHASILAELADAHSKVDGAGKARARTEALGTIAAIKFREEHQKATQAMLDNAAAAAHSIQSILKEGDARREANKTLGEQIEEIGLTVGQLDALRIKRIEAAKAQDEQTLAALQANEGTDAEIAAVRENIDLLERQISLRRADKAARDRESNDPTRGAQRALDDYVDTAKKAGDAAEALTKRTTQGLEDGLTAALTGGKFGIHQFVDEILAEIVRLSVVKPFLASIFSTQGASLAGGIGSAVTGGIGGLFSFLSGLPSFAVGTPYVPQDTLAMVHKGERIVPAAQNKAGASGVTVSDNRRIYVDGTADVAKTTAATAGMLREYDRGLWQRLRAAGVA